LIRSIVKVGGAYICILLSAEHKEETHERGLKVKKTAQMGYHQDGRANHLTDDVKIKISLTDGFK
jgi:hypothetical protein